VKAAAVGGARVVARVEDSPARATDAGGFEACLDAVGPVRERVSRDERGQALREGRREDASAPGEPPERRAVVVGSERTAAPRIASSEAGTPVKSCVGERDDGEPAQGAGSGVVGHEALPGGVETGAAASLVTAIAGVSLPVPVSFGDGPGERRPDVDVGAAVSPAVGVTLGRDEVEALTGRDDVRVTVEEVSGDAALHPARVRGGMIPDVSPANGGDAQAGQDGGGAVVAPGVTGPVVVATVAEVAASEDPVRAWDVAPAQAEADEVRSGDGGPAAGVAYAREEGAGTREDSGASHRGGGDSTSAGFADGGGEVSEASPTRAEAMGNAISGDGRSWSAGEGARGADTSSGVASAVTDEGAQEPLGERVAPLAARIVVGVADRDGAWRMELQRNDAGLDVLLRGDATFVGAVRGVEGELRDALVGAGERDARVRVDLGAQGDARSGGAGHGAARDERERRSPASQAQAREPVSRSVGSEGARPGSGLRVNRIA
jgi:hypothetical protein